MMQALFKKGYKNFLHYLLLSAAICSIPLHIITMEQQQHSSWPIISFVHDKSPTSYTVGPFSLSITNGGIRHTIPLTVPLEEVSPMQRLQQKLVEKDRGGEKEVSSFVVHNSRYVQFVRQREQILDIFIECLHNSTDAKLQLLNLSFDIVGEDELSSQINTIFHEYLQSILTTFYTQDGQLKSTLPYDYDNAARRIGFLLLEFLPWDKCLKRVKGYKNKKIPGFEKFYNDMHSPWKIFKGAKEALARGAQSLFRSKQNFTQLKDQISNNTFNQDLLTLRSAYNQSDYKEAHNIIVKYRNEKVCKKKHTTALEAYDRSLLVDNYSQELIQSIEPVKRLQKIVQKNPAIPLVQHIGLQTERHVRRNALLGSQIDTVKYLVTALHRIPPKHLKRKESELDKEYAEAYDTFFDKHGLPVIFDYNEAVLNSVTLPKTLGNYGTTKKRLSLFKLASLCINPEFISLENFQKSLGNAVRYLCHALRDKDHAQTYHLLTEALYTALTDSSQNSLRATLIDCDFLPPDNHTYIVHDKVLEHVQTLVHTLEEPLLMDQEILLHNALSALSRVWAQAREGSKEAQKILEKPSATAALIEENFLNHSLDYENICLTSNYLQQRMNELGFNKLLTANAYAISAPTLKKYEARCKIMQKHNAVPNFTTITAIMHDAYTPRPIVSLLHDALELWNMANEAKSKEVREISITITECAEVAYDYHQEGDEYYKAYVRLGRGLYNYGLIVGQVFANKAMNLYQGTAAVTTHSITYCIKSLAQSTQHLIDTIEMFTNGISGKGFYLPRDYFKQQELFENPPNPSLIRDRSESIEKFFSSLGQGACTIFVFLARIGGADAYEYPDIQDAINAETCEMIESYVNNFIDLPNEKKVGLATEAILDFILPNVTFKIASRLCRHLHKNLQIWFSMQQIALGTKELETVEGFVEYGKRAELALVGATQESLIPNIMKTQGAPVKSGIVKTAVGRISNTIINYIKPGVGNIIKEFTSEIFQKLEGHIFSDDHIIGGIMNLGATRDIIVEKFANIILHADKDNFFKEGVNTIVTQINGHKVILKATVNNGRIINTNGYLWNKKNPRLIGNVFTYIMDIYK